MIWGKKMKQIAYILMNDILDIINTLINVQDIDHWD